MEEAITGTVRFSDGVEQPVCWNGAGGREVTGFTVMGVEFGPVRERVRELEDENAKLHGQVDELERARWTSRCTIARQRGRIELLEAQLAEGAQMYHRALGRGRELESLARDMAGLLHGICREGWTIDQARVSELLDAASGLGIDAESEES